MSISGSVRRAGVVLVLAAALVAPAQASASAESVSPPAVTHSVASTQAFAQKPAPRVTGSRQVGKVLTAVPGTWKAKPTTLRYQWMRNGKAIAHATAKTYKLLAVDGGTKIAVVVSAKRSGYKTTSRTSAASVIKRATFAKASRPTVEGYVSYGWTLEAKLGVWSPAPTASYQWKSGGKAIPGATRATYTVRKTDVGRQISVTVTGTRVGFTPFVSTSYGTKAVPAIQPPRTAIPADDMFLVNIELAPGTYVALNGTEDCEWERASRSDYLGYGYGAGQKIVTIAASDYSFYSEECGSWVPIASVPFTVSSSIDTDGLYAVASQVAAGNYTATNPFGNCSWTTYADFSGDPGSFIEAGYPDGPNAIAHVNATDVAFETDGCGTWTRVGN